MDSVSVVFCSYCGQLVADFFQSQEFSNRGWNNQLLEYNVDTRSWSCPVINVGRHTISLYINIETCIVTFLQLLPASFLLVIID